MTGQVAGDRPGAVGPAVSPVSVLKTSRIPPRGMRALLNQGVFPTASGNPFPRPPVAATWRRPGRNGRLLPAIEAATVATSGPGSPQALLVGWGSGSPACGTGGRTAGFIVRALSAASRNSSRPPPSRLESSRPGGMTGRVSRDSPGAVCPAYPWADAREADHSCSASEDFAWRPVWSDMRFVYPDYRCRCLCGSPQRKGHPEGMTEDESVADGGHRHGEQKTCVAFPFAWGSDKGTASAVPKTT